MTTSHAPKPRRTMLPPNLTRNYYEVRRLIAEGEGRELPHWYQLTVEQKLAEEREVELFRRAILRAEEEQDLVANFNAPAAKDAPAAESTEAAAPAVDCECPGCSTIRALDELVRQAQRLEVALGWDVNSKGQGAAVYAFKPVSLTPQERADLEKRAKEAIAEWVAKGKPLKMTGLVPAPRRGGLYGLGPTWSDLERWIFRAQAAAPRAFLRDL
ncbi:hypothetical protein ACIBU0_42415 [Streptomyces sp. NPDC049627]|uniref:hypothetical protein n=1 Tax=Streptomyces sp. NPDC049627 TaxID=3365595 RepID=UPI0037B2904E